MSDTKDGGTRIMDPNANLSELISLAERIRRDYEIGDSPTIAQVDRLAELVLALDYYRYYRSHGTTPSLGDEV